RVVLRGRPSSPTRRSSDLAAPAGRRGGVMGTVQIVTSVLAAAITVIAAALAVRAVRRMVAVIRLGEPVRSRFDRKLARTVTMLRSEEHTSELQSRENLVCR